MAVPAIDYTDAAAAFRRHRTLPDAVLEAWRRAVEPRLGSGGGHVLDVGAGTGQFCGPLAHWAGAGARVTALEPSAAMRAELRAEAPAPAVSVVAGRAEALPVRTGSVDVAWLSTVIHQFDDRAAALGELGRVVRPGGRVLVRGYLADLGPVGWLGRFPGIERSIARFPVTAEVVEAFAAAGMDLVDVVDVEELWSRDPQAWADGLREVRHSDSMLAPLTDDEFAAGLAAIRAEAARRPGLRTVPVALRLVTFER